MDSIVVDIEEAFETYDICKMLIVCPNNHWIEALAKALRENNHSVSMICSTMNQHIIRWNINQFITNHTRTLIIHNSFSSIEDVWNDINFIVCIDLTEEENQSWIEKKIEHSKPQYIHLYQENAKPQYYILNR